jgi:hypothetical protein
MEVQILNRLNDEITLNLNKAKELQIDFKRKGRALDSVKHFLNRDDPVNDSRFLQEVLFSYSYGWTVQSFSQSVYDEIINTGEIGIVSDLNVRNSIIELYNGFQLYERVSLPRTSEYAHVIYGIVPMEFDTRLKEELSEGELTYIIKSIKTLDLSHLITFEQNRVRFLIGFYRRIEEDLIDLQTKIESYFNN